MHSIAWSWSVECPGLNLNCLLKSMLCWSIKLISRLYINLSSIPLKLDKRDIGRSVVRACFRALLKYREHSCSFETVWKNSKWKRTIKQYFKRLRYKFFKRIQNFSWYAKRTRVFINIQVRDFFLSLWGANRKEKKIWRSGEKEVDIL